MYIPSFGQFRGGHLQTFVELIWNDPEDIDYNIICNIGFEKMAHFEAEYILLGLNVMTLK